MKVKVQLNNLRVAPRKSRLVVDLIRGRHVSEARTILEFTINKTADPVLKLLNSAVASALKDHKLEESNLYVSEITVGEGPKFKRSFPMSRGKAFPLMKRTSHISLTLDDGASVDKPKNDDVINKKKESEELKASRLKISAKGVSASGGKAKKANKKVKSIKKT